MAYVEDRIKHEFATPDAAVRFINGRHGKKLMVHIEISHYVNESDYFPGGCATIVSRKEMAKIIRSGFSTVYAEKGGKLRFWESPTVISLS